jgi:hypothetical protein
MKALATAAVIPETVSFIASPTTVALTAYCGGAGFVCDTAATIKETACADVVNSTSVETM